MADEQTQTPQTTGAVMDVQPPKPTSTTIAPADSSAQTPVATEPEAEKTEETPAQEVVKETPASPLAVPLGDKTAHHGRVPVTAMAIAGIVAVSLIGLTVFAFQKTNSTKSAAPTAQKTTPVNSIKSSDVDQVSTDVETAVQGIDDTKDFTTNDLSDAFLGL